MISVSFVAYSEEQAHVFVAHQRTIDTLLCLPYTPESRAEMIDQLRQMYADDPSNLAEIDIFDKTYNCNSALQWYTQDSFLFRIINQILRCSNVKLMFKFRYFLTDLYLQLHEIHRQTRNLYDDPSCEKLYRGQMMSRKGFHFLQQLVGHIISINTFFSTTTSLQVALTFTDSSSNNDDLISMLFCIVKNPDVRNERPYGNISHFSLYRDEEEVLFAMGSLFRIDAIEDLERTNPLPVVYLKMIDPMVVNDTHPL